nr:RNA-directed DNA polymerase, eukaryota [Tanacetum cinerariifolium]
MVFQRSKEDQACEAYGKVVDVFIPNRCSKSDESCTVSRDLTRHVTGKVKDIESITNLRTLLLKEGFPNVNLSYLGGLWVLIELENVSSKNSLLEHVGGINGEKLWILKTIMGHHVEYKSDGESIHGDKPGPVDAQLTDDEADAESDGDGVSETVFGDNSSSHQVAGYESGYADSPSLSHPTGFTPVVSETPKEGDAVDVKTANNNDQEYPSVVNAKVMNSNVEIPESSNGVSISTSKGHVNNGGSILDVLEDMIRVGQSMGYNLEGCMKDIERIIVVYAPQQLSMKRTLWDYIGSLLRRWNGEAIVMGDFNEMKGYSFTWSHPSATKMSKLDRFLVTEGVGSKLGRLNSSVPGTTLFGNWETLMLFWIMKSKVNWAIDGDKNSNFFHGVINKKRSQVAIRGVFVNGNWCTDPVKVKVAFKNHFQYRFDQPTPSRFRLNFPFHKRISPDQARDMDRSVSRDEIDFCCAVEYFFDHGSFVKGCNSSFIALIPKVTDSKYVSDFRPISLIGCVYKVVTKILANRLVTIISDIVSDTQSAFLAKRNILDGPFILNELLSWCMKNKKHAMFFKVDFAKAHDSVRWDYLLDVLKAFGFGPTWCNWIWGTLVSARASVLVNGSPTSEFSFHRGLKQGNPLAPFLFILVIESLHLSFSRASSGGVFNGIQINGSISISHLFYVDDAIFIGELMSQRSAWDDVVNKLRSRLFNWKVKTLSIGGRLTLLKLVLGASPLYYMSIFKTPKTVLKDLESIRSKFFNGADSSETKITWIAWQKVLASMRHGCLGVSSYYALNRALILKWVWRFISNDGSL